MKKILSFSMGLAFAFLASASPPTFAVETEPETGSSTVSENINDRAAIDHIAIMALDEGSNTTYFAAAYGRETVSEVSDGAYGSSLYFDFYTNLMTVSSNSASAAVDDRQRSCCNSMMMTGPALNKSSTGLATNEVAAPANLRHSMAWVTSYLSGNLRG
jgi:hypothetical protein